MAPAPLAKLCNYFGPQYALYFAYLRTYSLWLWPPAILGALLFIVQESVYGGQENVWGAFFCLLLIAWAAGFAQAWRRREAGLPRGLTRGGEHSCSLHTYIPRDPAWC